jgi:ADP-ribose pyrophosphatase YjhB (NUDIX family)
VKLEPRIERELASLGERFGRPRIVNTSIDDSFADPIRKPDRYGEVAMVIRRPNGKLLLAIKTFYPRGAHRLPTGGIHHGEGVYDALVREAHEETGLELRVERFLARISYHAAGGGPPLFHTFAFLLRETGGTLGAIDESEQIEEWREIDDGDLTAVASFLEGLRTSGTRGIGGSWSAWGKFRAVVHRAVRDALSGGESGGPRVNSA